MGKKQILIIDDEEDIVVSLKAILTRAGYETDGACFGPDAIEKAKARNFDLVFLDIHLPQMSGVEIFRELKKINPDLTVCLMTGWPRGVDVQKQDYLDLLAEGAADKMLRKPFSKEDVLKAAREFLED